jgi:hypothetical protein
MVLNLINLNGFSCNPGRFCTKKGVPRLFMVKMSAKSTKTGDNITNPMSASTKSIPYLSFGYIPAGAKER